TVTTSSAPSSAIQSAAGTAAREVLPPSVPALANTGVVPAPTRVQPLGRLALAVTPWGEVYVDGRRRGIAPPLQEIKLLPGKHVIEIRNTTFPRHSQTVDMEAEASVRIKHKFQ